MRSQNTRRIDPSDTSKLSDRDIVQIHEDLIERVFKDGISKPAESSEKNSEQERSAA